MGLTLQRQHRQARAPSVQGTGQPGGDPPAPDDHHGIDAADSVGPQLLERAGDARRAAHHQHPVAARHEQLQAVVDGDEPVPRRHRGAGRGEHDGEAHRDPGR
jgi:hypothetical protein